MTARIRSIGTAFIAAIVSVSGFGQSQGVQPIKTTLCELIGDPERFDNKLVEVRSEFVSRFQWEGFVDETCSAKIQTGVHNFIGDLMAQKGQYAFTTRDYDNTHPERLNWRPIEPRLRVDVKQDENYRAFRKYSDAKSKWPDDGRCQDCPLYRIIVTADGRFDYFPTQTVWLRTTPAEKAVGFSGGDLPLHWFVLQSVSSIAATPIDSSIYSEKKRRDLTLEEAYGLVKAVQRDHGEGGYVLDEYEVKKYPGFQFFQAVPYPPSGRIHYPVDLRTGDVWDEGACEKLTSPSLKKLQTAVRNHIGLTAEEYRKLERPCPFCEQ